MLNIRKLAIYIGVTVYGIIMTFVIQKNLFGGLVDSNVLSFLNLGPSIIIVFFIALADTNRNIQNPIPLELQPIWGAVMIVMINFVGWLPVTYVINRYLDNRKKPKCLHFRPKKR